ncbi:Aste57867_2745 [Aphanomyces stellatus]|uniref:Aste57867_2745 protein n=1 Tax=Aphanomyces stellatus TaxID=120398 RepID=A0A485KDE9_9STRA|nr:hypothetical protein As57867_002738 [Aphanomyces stellatus]VFT79937.1 Aste57867_2745 [Aphanomyces stellatus]
MPVPGVCQTGVHQYILRNSIDRMTPTNAPPPKGLEWLSSSQLFHGLEHLLLPLISFDVLRALKLDVAHVRSKRLVLQAQDEPVDVVLELLLFGPVPNVGTTGGLAKEFQLGLRVHHQNFHELATQPLPRAASAGFQLAAPRADGLADVRLEVGGRLGVGPSRQVRHLLELADPLGGLLAAVLHAFENGYVLEVDDGMPRAPVGAAASTDDQLETPVVVVIAVVVVLLTAAGMRRRYRRMVLLSSA